MYHIRRNHENTFFVHVTLYFTCKTNILRSNGSSTSSINKGRRQSMKSKDRQNAASHREEQSKTKITVLQEESQKKQP